MYSGIKDDVGYLANAPNDIKIVNTQLEYYDKVWTDLINKASYNRSCRANSC